MVLIWETPNLLFVTQRCDNKYAEEKHLGRSLVLNKAKKSDDLLSKIIESGGT